VGRIPETPPGVPTGLAWQRRGRIAAKFSRSAGIGGRAVQLAINYLVARRPRKVQAGGSPVHQMEVLGNSKLRQTGRVGTPSQQAVQRPNANARMYNDLMLNRGGVQVGRRFTPYAGSLPALRAACVVDDVPLIDPFDDGYFAVGIIAPHGNATG
jgi:hypothetical protein